MPNIQDHYVRISRQVRLTDLTMFWVLTMQRWTRVCCSWFVSLQEASGVIHTPVSPRWDTPSRYVIPLISCVHTDGVYGSYFNTKSVLGLDFPGDELPGQVAKVWYWYKWQCDFYSETCGAVCTVEVHYPAHAEQENSKSNHLFWRIYGYFFLWCIFFQAK